MIQALIRAFQTGGLELTAEEIADTLWLAAYIDTTEPTQIDNMANARHFPDLPSDPPLADAGAAANTTPFAQKHDAAPPPAQTEVHLPQVEPDKRSEVGGIRAASFRTPAATALPGKLALARSLRPLLRRIPTHSRMVLDETATAQRIADVRNNTPILQPGQERWLDLAIVVDEWQTMVIWCQTVTEFIELLQQIGAFRTIQTYWMATEVGPNSEYINAEQVKLYATRGIGGRRGRVCNERELIDQSGRRLILVLSDCTAPIWYNGAAGRLLALWGKSNIVALVQMLPTALWDSSMLAHAVQVYVSTLSPGPSNAELSVELPWYWMHQDKPAGYPVPVVTLEPEALAVWSKLLTGKGNISVPGFYLPLEPVITGDHDQEVAPTSVAPEERWQRFRATASPVARELAGYLSATPLSLPVMRLVQRVMLPQSRQVHLAEVFRSGLIQRVTSLDEMTDPDKIWYDFVDGLRNLLLTTILISDTKHILEKTSEYVSKYSDQVRKFHALILDPTAQGEFRIDEDSRPFACVAAIVLWRLGGQYAQLAMDLEEHLNYVGTIPRIAQIESATVNTESPKEEIQNLLDPTAEIEGNHNAIFDQSEAKVTPPNNLPTVPCPYRGLEPFEAEHAANYFGRVAMVQKLLYKLAETNFVAVVGPSGSGKSSLVRAGLIAALRAGKLPGSRDWQHEILRPGDHPLRALATPLVARLGPKLTIVERLVEVHKMASGLYNGSLTISHVLKELKALQTDLPRLLLIFDQFEEIFFLCTDEIVRRIFLQCLLTAAQTPWLSIVFTLRADFYGYLLTNEPLGKRIDAGLVNVLPMTIEEYRAAIEQPALKSGRRFEEGLVQNILADIEGEPGGLPLLQFTLTELWERQTPDGVLTHTAYAEIGGVTGAIAKRADQTLKSLNSDEQAAVRRIFTRLVRVAQPDEGVEDTKRRITLAEVDPNMQALVQKLADARLLVTASDEQSGSETVEVAHEALIRGWGELQIWLNSDREFLLWRQRLRMLVENWEFSRRDEGALLRGALLTEAKAWDQVRSWDLSDQEHVFIAASHAVAERESAQSRRLAELEEQFQKQTESSNDSIVTRIWKLFRS